MRIGILGGTFDPIHFAHLRIAQEVLESCELHKVLFIPASSPPHKSAGDTSDFHHRLAMVQTAIADNPAFEVSDIESHRPGKSFSIQTLEILRAAHPGEEFYFIIGLDSFRDIATWRQYARLFELAHIVVAMRPGVFNGDPLNLLPVAIRDLFCYDVRPKTLRHRCGTTLIFVEETRLDLSSTRIRQLRSQGRSIKYLLPPLVEEYIISRDLYPATERS